MFKFCLSLLQLFFKISFRKKKDIILTLLLLKKENEILKRHLNLKNKKIKTVFHERFSISLIACLSKRAVNHLTIVTPQTLLSWQRKLISKRWTPKYKKKGRPQVTKTIKKLILEMKQDNRLWGCRKISDELKKVGIDLHHTTVNRIIQTFRKNGQIKPIGFWKQFLKSHWDSLYGMDFLTLDTLFGKRFYVLIILELKSRRIVKWDITEFPTCEFVRQRIIDFSYEYSGKKNLVHDNAAQFTTIDFSQYDIHSQTTALASPNMNAYTERVIGTIRREALDHFLLFSEKQIRNIIKNYMDYYNNYRPHQGINRIPNGDSANTTGVIKNKSILGGIHHHYFRSSA
jgi:putative transposase